MAHPQLFKILNLMAHCHIWGQIQYLETFVFLNNGNPVNIPLHRDHTVVSTTVNSQFAAVTTTHASVHFAAPLHHASC